jgi:CRP-like cAMP-binding protein
MCSGCRGASKAPAAHREIGRHAISYESQDRHSRARQNQLLAALPAADYTRLRRSLEPVVLPLGHILCEAGCQVRYAYFPVTGIVSLMQELASGDTTEVAVAGNDGMVGLALLMGGSSTTIRAFVRAAGMGYRVRADVLQREFEQCLRLRQILLRYTQSLLMQIGHNIMCGRHHSVEQQVCRLLLATVEASESNDLALTQELIAELVGARRESVTMVAGALQAAGVIHYHRGWITVLDQPALATRACECQAALRRDALHLFAQPCAASSRPVVVPHRPSREFALPTN